MKTFNTEEVNGLLDEFKDYILSEVNPTVRKDLEQFKKDKGLLPALGVGKWYKHKSGTIANKQGVGCSYGVNQMYGWGNSIVMIESNEWQEATHTEVETALKAEAVKRGFVYNVEFKAVKGGVNTSAVKRDNGKVGSVNMEFHNNMLHCLGYGEWCIFNNGQWATIIETNTELNELEKSYEEMGKKIEALKNK